MRKIFDDGLDELASTAHRGAALRVLVTLGVAALAGMVVPQATALAWAGYMLMAECASWFVTRIQALGRAATTRRRVFHVSLMFLVSLGWLGLGELLWLAGSSEGALGAVVIWCSLIFFTQTHAYQSRMGFIVGGVIPSWIILALVGLGPNPHHFNMVFVAGFFALSMMFAADGVKRMVSARARFDASQTGLVASEAQYRLLADNVSDVIGLSTVDGQHLYISPSLECVTGFTVDEMMAGQSNSFIHHEDEAVFLQAVRQVTGGQGPATVQYRMLHKDGSPIWTETTFSLVEPDYHGDVARLISLTRNISSRKLLETELIEARHVAEAAAAAKSEFLANMTHELRTPLNAIIGFSGLLSRAQHLGEEDARQVGLIHRSSVELLDLVNTVLDFSRLEAGGVEIEARPFDPADPARAVVALMADQAREKNIALELELEGESLAVLGDSGRIRQVLLNLVSNAIKFTQQGRVTLRVRQSATDGDCNQIRIEVADTGIGLSVDQIPALFERFTQADASVSRQFGGTGLGLAICRQTMDLMAGQIGATSMPGQGSTFWIEVRLPRTDIELVEDQGDYEADGPTNRPVKLLLVEDVAINRELITTLLAPFDIEIETASDGAQALEALDHRRFDMVLMDVQMPVMDGMTATRAIRRMADPVARSVPIVAMTANVLPEQVRTCLEAGMDDHMGKPVNPQRLLEVISQWAGGRPEEVEVRPIVARTGL